MSGARGKLVVISGPSGAGKTSVCRALKQHPDVEFSVSATTRRMREGERDGADYHFLSRDDFQRRLSENQFLEWATYNGNLYGTPRWPMDAALARGKTFLVEIDQRVRIAEEELAAARDTVSGRPLYDVTIENVELEQTIRAVKELLWP